MGTQKKSHHFVSRFYLEAFADKDNPPYLWLYDKDKEVISKVSPRDAGCRTLFYAFPKSDGMRDTNTLEDIFGDLESQVAPLLSKFESREELSNGERSTISLFMALTLTKVPNFRENIESHRAQFMKEFTKLMARKGGFDQIKDDLAKKGKLIDDELHTKMVQIMKEGKFDVEVAPHASIEQFLRLALELAPILHQMSWTCLVARSQYEFVTSDNPVSYADPTHDPNSLIGVGLKTPNVEVTFPITPKLAIFARWIDQVSSYTRATDGIVKTLNIRTIANAQRFVYASFRDDGFGNLVWRYSGTAPTARLEAVHRDRRTLFIFKGTALRDSTSLSQLVGFRKRD